MRRSVFSGSFYPDSKSELAAFIRSALQEAKIDAPVELGLSYVAPHAGYKYSGKVAAYTYAAMKKSEMVESASTIIVVGPNHTGLGMPIAVSMEDWETPFGTALNDKELSKELTKISGHLQIDEKAHQEEHSIEVQLPFLRHMFTDKKFVFICMGDQSVKASEIVANAITKAAANLKRDVVVVASSDLTHYAPGEIAKDKDLNLLHSTNELDYSHFNAVLEKLNHSACGHGPISVSMIFAASMGAKKGITLKYANSGDVTGDYSSVVGYSSVVFI